MAWALGLIDQPSAHFYRPENRQGRLPQLDRFLSPGDIFLRFCNVFSQPDGDQSHVGPILGQGGVERFKKTGGRAVELRSLHEDIDHRLVGLLARQIDLFTGIIAVDRKALRRRPSAGGARIGLAGRWPAARPARRGQRQGKTGFHVSPMVTVAPAVRRHADYCRRWGFHKQARSVETNRV